MKIDGTMKYARFVRSRSGHFHLNGLCTNLENGDTRDIITSRVRAVVASGDDHGMVVTTLHSSYLVPFDEDNKEAFDGVCEVTKSLNMEVADDD